MLDDVYTMSKDERVLGITVNLQHTLRIQFLEPSSNVWTILSPGLVNLSYLLSVLHASIEKS